MKNFVHVRGDTLCFNFEVAGAEIDNAFFSARPAGGGDLVLQKSLGDGITELSDGLYCVRVAPEDTEDLKAGDYLYDLEIRAGEDVYTILRGILELKMDVTRRSEDE